MANTNASGTTWSVANFVGELFQIGADDTAFLRAIGGLNGGRQVRSWNFALAQTWALEAASQPDIDEADSTTAPTPWSYVRGQDTNVCQIFQQAVELSYAKLSNIDTVSGIPILGSSQPVQSELQFQIQAALAQVARDMDYTFLRGEYQVATSVTTSNLTRGIVNASSGGTNHVAAGTTALSTTHMNNMLRTMAGNGARFQNMVLWANAFQIQQISNIYGYAPQDRTVGGVAVKQVLTDFCSLGVAYEPNMGTDTILIADMSVIRPVFLPVPGKGTVFYEELPKTGANEKAQIYAQAGLDYGPEEYHGTITGLTTS